MTREVLVPTDASPVPAPSVVKYENATPVMTEGHSCGEADGDRLLALEQLHHAPWIELVTRHGRRVRHSLPTGQATNRDLRIITSPPFATDTVA